MTPHPAPTDDQADRSIRYDVDAGALVVAGRRRHLGSDPSNEQVLREYVDLVAECRGRPLGALAEVRDDDVDALALALDVDAERLVAEIEAVLARTPDEARRLAHRLRVRRVQLAAAVVAAGVVVGALAVSRGTGGEGAPTPTTVSTVPAGTTVATAPTRDATVPPATALIPPVTIGDDGVPSSDDTLVDGDVTLLEVPQSTELGVEPTGP